MNDTDRDKLIMETHEAVIAMKARCEPCRSEVSRVVKTVYGSNGTRGLLSRISVIEWAVFAVIGSGFIVAVGAIASWLAGKF